jgi:hypothetical protein
MNLHGLENLKSYNGKLVGVKKKICFSIPSVVGWQDHPDGCDC